MITDHPEKCQVHISATKRVHRFLKHYFFKLRGRSGGAFLMLWLFGGIILAAAGQGFIRILGVFMLVSFVASYIFIAYFYPDEDA